MKKDKNVKAKEDKNDKNDNKNLTKNNLSKKEAKKLFKNSDNNENENEGEDHKDDNNRMEEEEDENKMNIDEIKDKDKDKDNKNLNNINNMVIDDEVNDKNSIIVIRKNSIIKKVLQSFEFRNSKKENKSKEKEKK